MLVLLVYTSLRIDLLNFMENILLTFLESSPAFISLKSENLWFWTLVHWVHIQQIIVMLLNAWVFSSQWGVLSTVI